MKSHRSQLSVSLFILFMLLGTVFSAKNVQGQDSVVILHWNDFHGQVYPLGSGDSRVGGFRSLSAMVEVERQESGAERVLLLDAGDWFQGTPEGNMTEGRMIIDLFNEVGVDATAIGNHEFDFGVPVLRNLVEMANFPVLGANVLNSDRTALADYSIPSTIIERGGIRFGLIGVVTPDTKNIVVAPVAKELQFGDPTDAVRRELVSLREQGAECFVVLSHLGDDHDRELAAAIPELDLIIGGHSHTEMPPEKIGETTIVQADSNGKLLGRLEVKRTTDGFDISGRLLPVPVRDDPVSPQIESLLKKYGDEIDTVMATQVGVSPFAWGRSPRPDHDPNSKTRRGWHPTADPLGTWIASVMAETAGTSIAMHNRGGVRAALPEGPVTRRDLFQISPFGNTIVRARVTGKDLIEIARKSLEVPKRRVDVYGLEIGWRDGEEYGPAKSLAYVKAGGIPVDEQATYEIATNNYLAMGGDEWTVFTERGFEDTGVGIYDATVRALESADATAGLTRATEMVTYLQVGSPLERFRSLLGLLVILGIAVLLSIDRKHFPWRIVAWGIALQVILAFVVLRTGPGRFVFDGARKAFELVLEFSAQGAQFVWGPLGNVGEMGFIFAIQISATIILVSAVTALLYHIGLMQLIVYVLAKVMQVTMRTSGAESLAAAANVFVGQTEAPLVIRPYLAKLTSSETMCLMTGGMATVAGGVLAGYVGFGIDAGHLLAASVMSAPAALAIAKIMVPEREHPATAADVPFSVERTDSNLLDAACRGASDGLKLSLNVMAMLIAFIALVAMIDWGIGAVHSLFLAEEVTKDPALLAETKWTLAKILGWVFAPIAWLLGVPREEMFQIGSLLGIKMTLNEFLGYIELSSMRESLSPRSTMIATYALCGFANFASIAIQIGGISAVESKIRPTLAKFGFRAMLGGTLAALSTACVAGVLI